MVSKKGKGRVRGTGAGTGTGTGAGTGKLFPNISQLPLSTLRQTANLSYALSIMKHPDPIGHGLGTEAFVESAGADCVIPGYDRPPTFRGLQLWPINVNFLKPITREIKTVGKILDSAFDLMNAPFGGR